MIEFMRGIRTPLSTTSIPASLRMVSNKAANFPSRSRIRNRARAAGVLEVHDKVLRGLGHPRCGRVRGGTEYPKPAAGVLDHREHIHPCSGQGDRLQEVARQQG